MSIRARLLLLVLFATLVPGLVTAFQFLERRDVEVASARRDLTATAHGVADALVDGLRSAAQLHYGLSRARDLDTNDQAACSGFLAKLRAENPQYANIATIHPDGALFCDSLRRSGSLNLADRRYFQDALRSPGRLAIEPVFSRASGRAALQVASTALDEKGKPAFVLFASLDLEKFSQLHARLLRRETAVIALVDSAGTVLSWDPGGNQLRGSSMAGSQLLQFALGREGVEAQEIAGPGDSPRIWAASALPEFPQAGLHVLVGVSKMELLAAANQQLAQSLAVLGLVSLLTFAGAWWLVDRAIRRPTERIDRAVARFSAGDLGARLGQPYPGGEIGGVMLALDSAFEATQAAHQRLADDAEVLRRANRALDMLSRANQALLQARDEDALLRDVCRIVVETGGYRRCRLALAGQDSGTGCGPIASAIRGGVAVLEKNLPADPGSALWRECALQPGDAALLALPIGNGGQGLGALVIYAGEAERFDEGELGLLTGLAADLDYGIRSLRSRAELDQQRQLLESMVEQQTETVAALRDNELRTRLIIDTALDAVVSINAGGLVTDWNTQAEATFGWTRDQAVGRSLADLIIPARYREGHLRALARFRTTGEGPMLNRRIELAALHRDGHEMPVELSISPMRVNGEWVLSAFLRDITDRRKVEERARNLNDELDQRVERRTAELAAARELADLANRAKSTFLATMSHEIRTPMNGMLGMLELLERTRLDAEQIGALDVIRESGQSLLRIIDDILDFTKIEAGKLEVRPEAASIREVIDGVHKIYAGSASAKGLLLRHHVDPQISPVLRVDPLRLRQILNNFVSNALKFTLAGEIDIRAERIERIDGIERVRFTVRDTGVGISADNQRQLFQPFSQGDSELARQAGGTGLGLTICRRLAGMMGGTVGIASEHGKGTTMTLVLPLPVAQPQDLGQSKAQPRDPGEASDTRRRAAPSVPQAEAEGRLVLLVDDHPLNRMLLLRQVNMLGYAAESAEDGVQALALWRTGRFAIVITDCNMPEMDGYQLARSIRALEAEQGGKRTPIVACTANALRGEAEVCLAAGMDDYLVKPVQLAGMLEKLTRWLPPEGVVPAA